MIGESGKAEVDGATFCGSSKFPIVKDSNFWTTPGISTLTFSGVVDFWAPPPISTFSGSIGVEGSRSWLLAFWGVACLSLAFFLWRISPRRQRWQWRHSSPFWQPFGFQNHAQGLHSPVPCSCAPTDMLGWRSGTSTSASASSLCPRVGDRHDVVDEGLAAPFMAASFAFFRSFTSPSGQRWQYPHSLPRWHPWGFQYQAQGLHSVPCRREPGVSAPLRGERSDASEALSLSSAPSIFKARDATGNFGGSLASALDELGLSSGPPSTRLAQLLSIVRSIFHTLVFRSLLGQLKAESNTRFSSQTLKPSQTIQHVTCTPDQVHQCSLHWMMSLLSQYNHGLIAPHSKEKHCSPPGVGPSASSRITCRI